MCRCASDVKEGSVKEDTGCVCADKRSVLAPQALNPICTRDTAPFAFVLRR